jgi:hypothetical protein
MTAHQWNCFTRLMSCMVDKTQVNRCKWEKHKQHKNQNKTPTRKIIYIFPVTVTTNSSVSNQTNEFYY